MMQHYQNRGKKNSFAGKYYCYKLVYYERFPDPESAIDREKQLKRWNRQKKEWLIKQNNPKWNFLNKSL